jgi:tetratricopeptide (TPR) repeat protein
MLTTSRAFLWIFVTGACAIALLTSQSSMAAETVSSFVETNKGYGRVVFEWADRPEISAEIKNGVLVVSSKRAFSTDLAPMTKALTAYVSIIKFDQDQKTLRFALKGPLRVATSTVENQAAVDLLPLYWKGDPPGFFGVIPEEEFDESLLPDLPTEAQQRRDIVEIVKPPAFPKIGVRAGEHPTFTRVVFDWPEEVEFTIHEDLERISVEFDRGAKPKLTQLRVDPPRFIKTANYKNVEGKLRVSIDVVPGLEARGFRDGPKIAIDLAPTAVDELGDLAASERNKDFDDRAAVEAHVDQSDNQIDVGDGDHEEDSATNASDLIGEDAEAAVAGAYKDEALSGASASAHAAPKLPTTEHHPHAAESHVDEVNVEPETTFGGPFLTPEERGLPLHEDFKPTDAASPTLVVRVNAKNKTTTLRFPWEEDVEAAVFRRADFLWIVFGEETEIDLSAIGRQVGHHILSAEQILAPQATVVRLRLQGKVLASAKLEGTEWEVAVGNQIIEPPASVPLERVTKTVGPSSVLLNLGTPSTIYWVRDPEVGDDLAVATAGGPVRGVITTRQFVEFKALQTAHGVAIQPLTDELYVGIEEGDVSVTSNSGLTLSAIQDLSDENVGSMLEFAVRPGLVDFTGWGGGELLTFAETQQQLSQTIIASSGPELEAARMRLARFYLAHEFPAETLGLLRLVADENPSAENTAAFRLIRGVAALMMHRLSDAEEDLSNHVLDDNSDAALWRGLLASEIGEHAVAVSEMERAEAVLPDYPAAWRARFRLAHAKSSVERNDLAAAEDILAEKSEAVFARSTTAEMKLVHAKMLEGLGRADEAVELYEEVAQGSYVPAAVRADLANSILLNSIGAIDNAEAIDRLDRLRFKWRGDETELEILEKLGRLFIEERRFRRGLETMRSAVAYYPNNETSRAIAQDMSRVFVSLYLEGAADVLSPVQALGLYYDFRELTPIGRQGDAMIRRLAERLIKVDLLSQATELLEHQVTNRLQGAAKAQVATRLAVVYMMDRKADKALRVIRSTRQAQLPAALESQRTLLEARALMELGLFDHALEVLADDADIDTARIRAEVYWRANNWREAGKGYEGLLGKPAAAGVDHLSEEKQIDVLRAAIAYALSDNAYGIERLQKGYGQAMTNGQHGAAFATIAEDFDPTGIEIRQLIKNIASVDTMETFLDGIGRRFDDQAVSALN